MSARSGSPRVGQKLGCLFCRKGVAGEVNNEGIRLDEGGQAACLKRGNGGGGRRSNGIGVKGL